MDGLQPDRGGQAPSSRGWHNRPKNRLPGALGGGSGGRAWVRLGRGP